jgi:hypothetical protein
MSITNATALQRVDPAVIEEVVRQDQRSPTFEIDHWEVVRLSTKGIRNTEGLFLFRGKGEDRRGVRSWSVVLKVLFPQEPEPPLNDRRNWRRELLVAESGLLESLPGPVRAPRFYRVDRWPDESWLWMEHIESRQRNPWALEKYAFAAKQLGRWNGACLVERPLPTAPWLARQHYRTWLSRADPQKYWQFPLHQKYIRARTRDRLEQLWAERESFFQVLEALPQCFSHFDSQRRNLFIVQRQDGSDELVLIDWALCGLGPLGAELYALVGMSSILLEWSPAALPELDAAAFGSYLSGLQEAGWRGDARRVRLGYVAWLAVWVGCIYLLAQARWCSPEQRSRAIQQFGMAEEELYIASLPCLYYVLDCADEVRRLMRELGLE